MAFKLAPSPTFTVPVTVNVANDRGGYDKNTFEASFARTTVDELQDLSGLTTVELVRKKLKGWKLKDSDTSEDVPFTPENLELVLSIPPSPLAITTAFYEGVNGAKAKN